MKKSILLLFLFVSTWAFAAPKVNVFYEYTPSGYTLFASNEEPFSVEITLELELNNLKVEGDTNQTIVVPPQQTKFELVNLVAVSRLRGYSFDFNFSAKKVSDTSSATSTSKEMEIIQVQKSKDNSLNYVNPNRTAVISNIPQEIVERQRQITDAKYTSDEMLAQNQNRAAIRGLKQQAQLEAGRQEEKQRLLVQQKIKEEARLEEQRLVELAEAAARQEERRQAEELRKEEVARAAEEARLEEMKRLEEEARLKATRQADEQRWLVQQKEKEKARLEEQRLVELAEAAARQAERRQAEELRKEEVARAAEEARLEKMKRQKEEQLLAEQQRAENELLEASEKIAALAESKMNISKVNADQPIDQKPLYEPTGKYDAAYVYSLPFENGTAHVVLTGYNNKTTHQGAFAIDFSLPENSVVHAARPGIVVEVVDQHEKGCGEPRCVHFDNYVVVAHEDGTYAKYAHINSSAVGLGDTVEKDQLLAYSGSTGWTTDPALHFEVFSILQDGTVKTLKTNFLQGDGSNFGVLQEGVYYSKDY